MPRPIAYFFSLVSPWSYLGHAEFTRIVAAHDLTIVYKPADLMRVFPETGGLPLSKRHPARQSYRMFELQRWRAKRQVPMHLRPKFWPFDFNLADRVVVALAAAGADVERFLPRAFAAIFEGEQNLADEATLIALLDQAGLDAPAIMARAKSAATAAAYAGNVTKALATGVFGAPTYVLDGELFWGQDRLGLLDEALASHRKAFSAAD